MTVVCDKGPLYLDGHFSKFTIQDNVRIYSCHRLSLNKDKSVCNHTLSEHYKLKLYTLFTYSEQK